MASKVCLNCKAVLPADAIVCYRCAGRSFGPQKKSSTKNVMVIAGGSFAILLIAAGIGGSDKKQGASSSEANSASSSGESAISEASTSESANLTDASYLDEKYSAKSQGACSSGADDYLRSIAKYDFGWDDDAKGFLGIKFDKYLKVVNEPGVLTLSSTRAKLQNGFGAWQHIDLYCKYDTQAGKVVDYFVDQKGAD